MNRALPFVFSILAVLALSTPRSANASEGRDFAAEAHAFYRVVACSDDGPVPAGFDADVVRAHCELLHKKVERFRKRYVNRAEKFIGRWKRNGLPTRVVYPFGGGDLVSALVTYPNLTEVTTISLENAGDPRRLTGLDKKELEENLELYNEIVGELLKQNDSSSENLRKMERGPIPGQLSFFMLALVIHGFEPVSLKYFRIEDDGSIHYYTQAEIDSLDGTQATKLNHRWVNTDYSVAFRNMELTFRRRGAGADAPLRVHRHIAYNLDNQHFGDSPLLAHLRAKGKVVAMTKAASYLLWSGGFSKIRTYLLRHMVFMVSDATGIQPKYAERFGFEQITFGKFTDAYLEWAQGDRSEPMRELWETNRQRGMPFRYGYPDAEGNFHMMITRVRHGRRARRVRAPKLEPAARANIPPERPNDDSANLPERPNDDSE